MKLDYCTACELYSGSFVAPQVGDVLTFRRWLGKYKKYKVVKYINNQWSIKPDYFILKRIRDKG